MPSAPASHRPELARHLLYGCRQRTQDLQVQFLFPSRLLRIYRAVCRIGDDEVKNGGEFERTRKYLTEESGLSRPR
jgi:hypothetical protein